MTFLQFSMTFIVLQHDLFCIYDYKNHFYYIDYQFISNFFYHQHAKTFLFEKKIFDFVVLIIKNIVNYRKRVVFRVII